MAICRRRPGPVVSCGKVPHGSAVRFPPVGLVGEPVAVAEQVGSLFLSASFSASANGVLAYRRASAPSALTWYDRQGKVLSIAREPGAYTYTVALSPDGARVATTRVDPAVTGPNPGNLAACVRPERERPIDI